MGFSRTTSSSSWMFSGAAEGEVVRISGVGGRGEGGEGGGWKVGGGKEGKGREEDVRRDGGRGLERVK